MNEPKRKVYVGIICNDRCDTKTLVTATSADDAKAKILDKYKNDIGVYFQESDVQVRPFFE